MTHHAPNCATRGLDLCDCQPVLAARATLTERAIEAVKHAGTNPYDWDLTDDVADAAENGLTVTRAEMARAMIEVALDTVEDELVDECDEELRLDLRRRRIDLSEIRTAIEFDECGLSVDPQYLRDWLRVQGISKVVA